MSNQRLTPLNVYAAASAPAGARAGDTYYNTAEKRLYSYDGTAWAPVDVTASPTFTGAVSIAAGSASAPSLTFTGDTNTGLWSPAADTVAASTGGTERMRIDSSGNVGIGTSSPAARVDAASTGAAILYATRYSNNANQPPLFLRKSRGVNVGDNAAVQDGDGVGAIFFQGNDGSSFVTTAAIEANINGTFTAGSSTPSRLSFQTTPAGSTTLTERMRIDNAGNVGIGTSSPSSRLTVSGGDISVSDFASDAMLYLSRASGSAASPTVVAVDDQLGNVYFAGYDGAAYRNAAAIRGAVDATPGSSDMPGRLVFLTTADGASSLTERMRITSAGNVGIGTTAPSSLLHIQDNTSTVTPLTVDSGGGADTTRGIAFNVSGANYGRILTPSGSGGAMALWTGTAGAAAERMRIDSSGRVLIGTTAAISVNSTTAPALQVAGGAGGQISVTRFSADSTPSRLQISKSRSASIGTQAALQSGDLIGAITFNGSDGTNFIDGAIISAVIDAAPGTNDMPTALTFATTVDGGSGSSERLRITSSGNVGIGTTSPTTALDVVGDIKSSANITSGAGVLDQAINFSASGSVLDNLPSRIHPGEQLLKQSVWWIDAAHSSAGNQTVSNLGWGGSALDARAGSTTSADTNDPKYLSWEGESYVYLPGVAGNRLSLPSISGLTGDIDIRAKVSLDDWTPSAGMAFVSQRAAAGRTWQLGITALGQLQYFWSTNGTTDVNVLSTVSVPISDGATSWVRVTQDVDNGASGNTVVFYTSTDGLNWTQLGTSIVTAGIAGFVSVAIPISIGSNSDSGELFTGKFYRAQILNGINGTPVLDVDTSLLTSGSATTFPALTGQTVTINRSTSGRKSVAVVHPCWPFGTDDYMEVPAKWIDGAVKNVYLPGIVGNYMTTPDAAALDITGDIDIRVRVAMDDWTPAAVQYLATKYGLTANHSYIFYLSPSGGIGLQWSTDGSTILGAISTVATGLTDGTTKWVRATLDVDNGATGRDIKFYTSDDNVTWTQLGATVTQAGTTSIFSGTSPLYIGTLAPSTGQIAGNVYNVQIYNGIAGTKVLDVDTSVVTDVAQTTLTAVTGQTITLVKTGTSYVTTPMLQSGYVYPTGTPNNTPSTYSLLDFGATDSFTVLTVVRQWATPTNFGRYISKTQTGGPSWSFVTNGTTTNNYLSINDGTTAQVSTNVTSTVGALSVMGGIIDRSGQVIRNFFNGALAATSSTSTIGSLSNTANLQVGVHLGTGSYQDFEFVAAAIFRRALTATEIAQVNSYFQGRAA